MKIEEKRRRHFLDLNGKNIERFTKKIRQNIKMTSANLSMEFNKRKKLHFFLFGYILGHDFNYTDFLRLK